MNSNGLRTDHDNDHSNNADDNDVERSTAQAAGDVGSQQLAGNFNTFLTLLTTQLQNQDPLSPLDTNQFTQQLVEFGSGRAAGQHELEPANPDLDAADFGVLAGAATGRRQCHHQQQHRDAVQSDRQPGDVGLLLALAGHRRRHHHQLDRTGRLHRHHAASAGNQTYTWNGQGNNGVTWPDGNYTLSINATGANGQPVTVSTQVQGTISSVNVSQNPLQVTVGGQNYPISAIQSINSGSISNSANSISNSIGNSSTPRTTAPWRSYCTDDPWSAPPRCGPVGAAS